MVLSMQHFKKASACERCFFPWASYFFVIILFFFFFLLLEASHKMSFPSSGKLLILAFSLYVFINFSCTMHVF